MDKLNGLVVFSSVVWFTTLGTSCAEVDDVLFIWCQWELGTQALFRHLFIEKAEFQHTVITSFTPSFSRIFNKCPIWTEVVSYTQVNFPKDHNFALKLCICYWFFLCTLLHMQHNGLCVTCYLQTNKRESRSWDTPVCHFCLSGILHKWVFPFINLG